MAAIALLHHPPRVEHRVVDADGEADDHHQLGHVRGQRVELADRPEQSDRADHGGGAEHQRDAGGDDRAERDQQDHQHQDERDALRVLAVLGVLSRDRLGRRGVAELLHAHARMRLLSGGHGGQRAVDEPLDLLVGAGDLEAHHDRVAVLGAQRRLDLGDPLDPLQAAHDVSDRGGQLRIVPLDEHPLAGLVGKARGFDEHVAALGLAVARGRRLEVVLTNAATEHGGEDDEGNPSEDRGLAVLRAPPAHSSREIP